MKVITNSGEFIYNLDNTGNTDVSKQLQIIIDDLNKKGINTVTFYFSPGIYYIDSPLNIKFISVKLIGEAHGGIDIHGMNLAGGTVFHFGKNCFPNCITFIPNGEECSFPAKESPWTYKTTRVCISNISFVGHNNTDVDTQNGYSRFRGDEPNFRQLYWYPKKDRYENIEAEGQRAIVIKKSKQYEKPEMLTVDNCYFTDLYVGLDIANCDVSNIHHSWFAQMVYGIRYHSAGQCIMMHDNCFADLQTAIDLNSPTMSTIHNNTFAYLSKCFVIENAEEVNISSNCVKNWDKAVNTASCGAFLYAKNSKNININANTVMNALDSKTKNCTVDEDTIDRAFIHFDKCENLLFSANIIDTKQTQSVICLEDCKRAVLKNNLINFDSDKSYYTEKGKCTNVICD